MKEVTVFTSGDSNKLSTWSNVPYFFTETLLAKGIKVNRVDISPSPVLNSLYRKTFWQLLKLAYKRTSYTYSRSLLHYLIVQKKIKDAVSRYPDAEANIFITFSFSGKGLSKLPSIQFCDWTYDHYLRYFEGREPDLFEKGCVEREDSEIENADFVFPLFPSVTEYMKSRYQNRNIHYLGNVINSVYEVSEEQIRYDKQVSYNLLFVGSKKYINGARCLVRACERLKARYPQLTLHIVGMINDDFEHKPAFVSCYGYLDKDKEADREQYYSLVQKAKIFINTTPKWGAFSATIEAMYFYTPVIVSAYDEFVETFGREIDFGAYCENDDVALATEISRVLDDESYFSLCRSAHASVEQFSWNSYIDKMLDKIAEKRLMAV